MASYCIVIPGEADENFICPELEHAEERQHQRAQQHKDKSVELYVWRGKKKAWEHVSTQVIFTPKKIVIKEGA